MDEINVQAGTYIFIIRFCLRNTLQYIIAHPWTLFHIWKKISRKKQTYKVKLIKFTVIKFSSFNVVCLCQGHFVYHMKITPFINLLPTYPIYELINSVPLTLYNSGLHAFVVVAWIIPDLVNEIFSNLVLVFLWYLLINFRLLT